MSHAYEIASDPTKNVERAEESLTVVTNEESAALARTWVRPATLNATVEGAGATIKKAGPGQYVVNCTQLGTVLVNINDGKQIQKIAIPVKRVPNPLALIGESAGGNMAANVFRVQGGVVADLKDFIFEGVKFNVTSFIVIGTGKGFDEPEFREVVGNKFSGGAQDLIKRCQPGSTVTIGEIKVSEPGGGTRKLDQTITFILQ